MDQPYSTFPPPPPDPMPRVSPLDRLVGRVPMPVMLVLEVLGLALLVLAPWREGRRLVTLLMMLVAILLQERARTSSAAWVMAAVGALLVANPLLGGPIPDSVDWAGGLLLGLGLGDLIRRGFVRARRPSEQALPADSGSR